MALKNILKLDRFIKLSLTKKAIIVAVVNVVIAGLFYQFLLDPKRAEINTLEVRMLELTAQLDDNRSIAKDVPRYKVEKEELEKQLEKAIGQLPNEKEIPTLIKSISDAGKKSGLRIILFRPKPESPKGFYAEVPVDMEVEGTYESVYSFCEKVSELPRIVNIEGINVAAADPKGFKSLSPALNAKFVATTFRFMAEGEQAATPKGKGK